MLLYIIVFFNLFAWVFYSLCMYVYVFFYLRQIILGVLQFFPPSFVWNVVQSEQIKLEQPRKISM